MSTMGHNSISKTELKAFVERIERLEEEKAKTAGDIKEVYAEAKGAGFIPKVIRAAVKWRREDAAKRAEAEALLEVYLTALGDLADLPLGEAAVQREGLRA